MSSAGSPAASRAPGGSSEATTKTSESENEISGRRDPQAGKTQARGARIVKNDNKWPGDLAPAAGAAGREKGSSPAEPGKQVNQAQQQNRQTQTKSGGAPTIRNLALALACLLVWDLVWQLQIGGLPGGRHDVDDDDKLPPSHREASTGLWARPSSIRQVSAVVVKPHLPKRELEKHIVDEILGEGYDKRIRPSGINNKTGQNDGPAVVRVNTLIRSISKIDDVTMEYSVQLSLRQEWVDERLAFNRMSNRDYKNYNINSITLTEQERLWKPDLFFRNEKEGHFHKIIMPNVLLRINGDGAVLYSIRISLVLACPMDLKYYPLDKQNCTIEMASYGYLDDDLKFIWKEVNPVQINQPLTLPRFTLETFGTAFCTSRTATGAYSCLRVDLIFKREFSYYLIQIYIPCCMLVIVSWVSFWLDPNAIPARVSLGVTTLLTMATQISGINASLPPVSYTKAIDVWTGVCLTFVFGALLEFALVNYASRSDAHARVQQARQEEELRVREMEFQRRQLAAAAQAAAVAAANQQRANPSLNQQQLAGYPQQAYAQYAFDGKSAGQTPVRQQNGALDFQKAQQPLANGGHFNPATGQFKGGSPVLAAAGGKGGAQSATCEIHHSVLHNMPNGGPMATTARAGTKQAHHSAANQQQHKKKVNFCRAWLNKFPSRSKRIDVISRIFFPKMFALFNLVYWTTYLFREDDVVRA